jgi:tRNA dimethylallyltransferase
MELARQRNGSIINADAMQIYAGLPLLTAQPEAADRSQIPHFLYEVTDAAEASSVGKWLTQAHAAIADVRASGRTPILVGGTGMYFAALVDGLSDIPDIPTAVRDETESFYREWGEEKFREELARSDPDSASRIERNDRQRLIRAFEVVAHTGKTLSSWHKKSSRTETDEFSAESLAQSGNANNVYERHLLMPSREELYAACDRRFLSMIEREALTEVKQLISRNLSPELPAMKILGVRELAAFLRNERTLGEAVSKAQQMTRNYAKRQMTWFRNQWKTAIS